MRRVAIGGVAVAMAGTLALMVLSVARCTDTARSHLAWWDRLKNQHSVETKVTRTFEVKDLRAIAVAAHSEDVEIVPSDSAVLTVSAVCTGVGATDPDAQTSASQVRWTTKVVGGTLQVSPEAGPSHDRFSLNFNGHGLHFNEGVVRFSVAVPRGARLPIEVNTGSGEVSVTGGTQGGTVRTQSGDVAISGRGAAEDLEVETGSGEVEVTQNVPLARVQRFTTSSGDVALTMPSGASMAFDLQSDSGDIENRLSDAHLAEDGHALRFAVGGAGAKIAVRTNSGDIRVGPAQGRGAR